MADQTPKSYHTDPNLYLYTSLTAGSSQIITATSRMETILKANKIQFQALDVATDEKARMLWGRRAGKRKLPGLVRMGMIVGDLEEVEEWNEYGELRDNVEPGPKPPPSAPATPSKVPAGPSSDSLAKTPATNPATPSKQPPITSSTNTPPRPSTSSTDSPLTTAMRQAGFEAAKKAGDAKSKARAEALQASRDKENALSSETLRKLDNSGPTGMPPPSGTTEAVEATKPETGNTSSEGKADDVPSTEKGEQDALKGGNEKRLSGAMGAKESTMRSSKKAEEVADTSILADESEEVLEGRGQAEPTPEDRVRSAREVEEAANASIMHDKSHIVLVGQREADRSPPSEPVEEAVDSSSTTVKEGSKLKEATNVSDEVHHLPGKKTQDQPAASGEQAGILNRKSTTSASVLKFGDTPALRSHGLRRTLRPIDARYNNNQQTRTPRAMLFFSFFKTLVDHEVTVELKNDISIRGVLKSVDQFLNIKLDDIQVVEELKYPHLSSVKNVFIRGSVVRYVHLPGAAVDVALLEDATRREAASQASKPK